jgi:uncharacterized membrane protein
MTLLGILILVIVAFAIAGLGICVYLTVLHFKLQPFYNYIPKPTTKRQISSVNDAAVLNHPGHRLLGIPNTIWGIGYYLFILLPFAFESISLLWAARFFAGVFLLLTVYFGLRIPKKLNSRCFLCMVINIINSFLAALLWNMPGFY